MIYKQISRIETNNIHNLYRGIMSYKILPYNNEIFESLIAGLGLQINYVQNEIDIIDEKRWVYSKLKYGL